MQPTDELADGADRVLQGTTGELQVPAPWEFRDDLPRTEAGKLYKRKLRDEYVAATNTAWT